MAYIETVITLTTILIYGEIMQIVITCLLAFTFSQFTQVLHCNVPTAAGLLASFITVPTLTQLRTSQIALLISKRNGFTIWYKRLAIGTCTIFQTAAVVLSLINLLSLETCDESFLDAMHEYGNKQKAKSIVDNIQWFMQCCGNKEFRDWFTIDWGNFVIDPFNPKANIKAVEEILRRETDEYPDLTVSRSDAVPFSCCAEKASSACIHQNLEQFGTYTINAVGCGKALQKLKSSILIIEFIIYTTCLLIEMLIMFHLCKSNETYEMVPKPKLRVHFKAFHKSAKPEYSKFLNEHSPRSAATDDEIGFISNYLQQRQGMHTIPSLVSSNKMDVHILPALSDNYMYLITDKSTNEAAVVDPVVYNNVLECVDETKVNLTKILTTHHHWDHAGGNVDLIKRHPGTLEVIGGDDRINGLTKKVQHGDKFKIGNIEVECLSTPCHTSGHICYYLTAPGETPVVFTGDTLFVGGCGRFFEGSAEQMYAALVEKLGNLPVETKVFCGHEYTVQNLKFAQHVEGENEDVKAKMAWALKQREKQVATIPSTIAEEKLFNPFMRVDKESVQLHAGCTSAVDAMRIIRKEKDNFTA